MRSACRASSGHSGHPVPPAHPPSDGAGWLAVFRDLTARGLSGVALVTPTRTAA